MKKIGVILLLLLYGTSSIGMTLHFHYCCGKLKKVDFSAGTFQKCLSSVKVCESSSCCGHKQIVLKVRGEQSPAKTLQNVDPFSIAISLGPIQTDIAISPLNSKNLLPEVFAPPPLRKDILHFYCTYRI